MNICKYLILVSILFFVSSPLLAEPALHHTLEKLPEIPEETPGILVTGKNFAIAMTIPEKWIADRKSGITSGFPVVFFKKNETWETHTTIIYLIVNDKEPSSLEEYIKKDIQFYLDNIPDITMKTLDQLLTKDQRKAHTLLFSSLTEQIYEAISYIEGEKLYYSFVLFSRDELLFQESLPAFQKIISSSVLVPAITKYQKK